MMQGIGWQDIFDILFIVLFDMMYFAIDPVGKLSLSPLELDISTLHLRVSIIEYHRI